MAWARRLPSGRWQGLYRNPSGNVKAAGAFDLKREALDAANDLQIAKHNGRYRDPKLGRDTFAVYFEAFLAGAHDIRPRTRQLYATEARLYLLPRIGSVRLSELQPATIRRLLADLVAEGVGARTIELVHQTLSKALTQAVADGILVANPASLARPPKAIRKPVRILESHEVEALAAAIDERYRAMVLVAGWAGLRFGEAAALRRDRLRLLERRIDVVEGISTDAAGRFVVGPLKTDASRRSVTIPAFLVDELAAHLATYADPLGDLVFTAPLGGLIQRPSWRTRFWLPAVRAARLHPAPTFHHLRHHAAAVAIAAGAHPKAISARLGHTSVSMTLDVYGHLFPNLDEDLAAQLDIARDSAARLLHETPIAAGAEVTPIRSTVG